MTVPWFFLWNAVWLRGKGHMMHRQACELGGQETWFTLTPPRSNRGGGTFIPQPPLLSLSKESVGWGAIPLSSDSKMLWPVTSSGKSSQCLEGCLLSGTGICETETYLTKGTDFFRASWKHSWPSPKEVQSISVVTKPDSYIFSPVWS